MTKFPIAPATSNLTNRISYGVLLALIVLMIYLITDIRSLLPIILLLPMVFLLIYLIFVNKLTIFTVDNKMLSIKRALYGTSIDINSLDIENAQVLDLTQDGNKPLRPIIRTNGIGLPYYQAGWFRLRNGDKALLFTTNNKNVVYIPTSEGFALMLSVDNPDKLLESIKH